MSDETQRSFPHGPLHGHGPLRDPFELTAEQARDIDLGPQQQLHPKPDHLQPNRDLTSLDKVLIDYTLMREELDRARNLQRNPCTCHPGFRCIVCYLVDGEGHAPTAAREVLELREASRV